MVAALEMSFIVSLGWKERTTRRDNVDLAVWDGHRSAVESVSVGDGEMN